MRLGFDAVKKPVNGVNCGEISILKSKLYEKGIEQSKQLIRAVDQLTSLIKHDETTPISQSDFELGILRLEKRTLFTFTSKLF